ncbi:MAG TPA: hypothetical protein VNR65_02965, partial [Geobacterales bacterium]|nr:hypothetical protein [Geobacterales bacterium]
MTTVTILDFAKEQPVAVEEPDVCAADRKVLVADVGGNHVKLLVSGQSEHRKVVSGPSLTPELMMAGIKDAVADWDHDVVTIGYPGPVLDGRPLRDPHNLGAGWVQFDFEAAFGR